MRRAAVAGVVALAAALAGCGGGGGASATSTTMSAAQQKAAISATWESFFSPTATAEQEAALLQNGATHTAQMAGLRKMMPAGFSVKVDSVTLNGTNATVTYDLLQNGQSILGNASTGTAVEVGGKWLVSEKTFCSLVALAGSPCQG